MTNTYLVDVQVGELISAGHTTPVALMSFCDRGTSVVGHNGTSLSPYPLGTAPVRLNIQTPCSHQPQLLTDHLGRAVKLCMYYRQYSEISRYLTQGMVHDTQQKETKAISSSLNVSLIR